MGLYDKYARLAGERLQFSDNGLTPFGTCIDEVYSATEGRIGNKKVILAGTNNYLGLTFNHDAGNDSNLLIVFYVQIMPDDFVMQLHRF